MKHYNDFRVKMNQITGGEDLKLKTLNLRLPAENQDKKQKVDLSKSTYHNKKYMKIKSNELF